MARRPQETRILSVATPLETDTLLLDSISGREELGGLFSYELDRVSDDPEIDFNKLLGEKVTVRVRLTADEERHIDGFVTRFSSAGLKRGLRAYSAIVMPWLWFLSRTSDCRIYQDVTVKDVITSVFEKHGYSDFSFRLNESYRTWEYLVQYKETDLNFVSRLMEQEGIYYYFLHENGRHTLVLADSATSHDPLEGEAIPYFPPQEAEAARGPHVWDWHVEKQVQPGAIALTDYNFEKPSASLLVRAVKSRKHAASNFEMFDYPGEYPEFADGERYAGILVDEYQASHETIQASGNVRQLSCGCTFKISDEHSYLNEADTKREYLLVSLSVEISEPEDFDTGGSTAEAFAVTFLAIPYEQRFRPARTTPKPTVNGLQTAKVVGPSGEEIHTDIYGRIKVHFHWDRHGKADENDSCWIRVAQPISGKQWGALHTPRIGHEVIVEFLEGDPDRPLVTGSVYNANNKPPYVPQEMPTISGYKSNSSKGGGGFNELRFEDKKGEEQVFIHGEKNLDIRVKNDRFETIVHDRHLVVENDKLEHIKNDRSETIDRDHKEKIGRDRNLKVEGKEAIAVAKSRSVTVTGDVAEVFKKNQSTVVTKDLYIKADNICIEALTNITIKVGKSYIAIESGGIKIGTTGDIEHDAKGNISTKAIGNIESKSTGNTKIEATGNADIKSTGMMTVEGSAPTTVKSAAILTIQGSLVKIN